MARSSAAVRRARRQWGAFGVLLALSVVMVIVSGTGPALEAQSVVRFAFKPVVETLDGTADTVGSLWTTIDGIDRMRTENEQLQTENDTLRRELARMPAIQRLNDDWTAITKYQEFVSFRTSPARVLIRDISDIRPRTIIIDKGSDDGMKEDHIVIAAGGALVGRIDKVDRRFSEVRLINDLRSTVTGRTISASDPTQGATGSVSGQPGGLLQMSDVLATETLNIGEQVVTAGYDLGTVRSLFPPGLLIGRIIDVTRDPNAVVQTAFLQADVDFQDLNYVLVITNYQGGLQEPSSSPSATPTASPAPSVSPRPTPRPSASRKP